MQNFYVDGSLHKHLQPPCLIDAFMSHFKICCVLCCQHYLFISLFHVRVVGVDFFFCCSYIIPNTLQRDLRLRCALTTLTIRWAQSFCSFLCFFFFFFNFMCFSCHVKSSWKLRTFKISSELLEANRTKTFCLLQMRKVSYRFSRVFMTNN